MTFFHSNVPYSLAAIALSSVLSLVSCQTSVPHTELAPEIPPEPDPEFAEGIPLGTWEHRRRVSHIVAPLNIQQNLTLTPSGEAVVWTRYEANNDTQEGIEYGRFVGQKRIHFVTNHRIRSVSRKENEVHINTGAAKRPRLVHAHPKGSSIIDMRTLGGTAPDSVLFAIDNMGKFRFEIDGKDLLLVDEENETRIRYRFTGRE